MTAMPSTATLPVPDIQYRQAATGHLPTALTGIYREDVNIAIWRRQLESSLEQAAHNLLEDRPILQLSVSVTPQNVYDAVVEALGPTQDSAILSEDITQLLNMFCCLFDLKHVGLRLTALDQAMCPRFHVDRVPCRLVTTYCGSATEWLADDRVDRSKLGAGNQGLPDTQSGIYPHPDDIRQLSCGDVAILKGELWEGNEQAGLVHRSPQVKPNQRRLLMTLDFQ